MCVTWLFPELNAGHLSIIHILTEDTETVTQGAKVEVESVLE